MQMDGRAPPFDSERRRFGHVLDLGGAFLDFLISGSSIAVGMYGTVHYGGGMMARIDGLLALGVVLSTAATDAVYVMFNAAVSSKRRVPAATWSSVWYLLSAFAVFTS